MARLEAPVMNTRRRAPAARASSTAYWISGLSTTGSISFGLALVAGRKRVPRPATGNTAFVILRMAAFLVEFAESRLRAASGDEVQETGLIQYRQAEFHGLCKLGSGIGSRNHVAG